MVFSRRMTVLDDHHGERQMKVASVSFFIVCFSALLACNSLKAGFPDKDFADQDYKDAVAQIELYKLRYDEYPDSLDDLTFVGQWDGGYLRTCDYKRLNEGYELNVVASDSVVEGLQYPKEFYQGLGLVKSNVMEK